MTKLLKPVKRTATCQVPHGVNPSLVITLHPGGTIGLRESRRRREYLIAAGRLYAQLVAAEAQQNKIHRRRRG